MSDESARLPVTRRDLLKHAGFHLDGQRGAVSFKPVDDFKADHAHLLWQQFGSRAAPPGSEGGMDEWQRQRAGA